MELKHTTRDKIPKHGYTDTHIIITLFVRLYVRVAILLADRKNLHDRIISLRGKV